jgi:hypothetical protein
MNENEVRYSADRNVAVGLNAKPGFRNRREEVLLTANSLVNGDRNAQYGEPNQAFSHTAALWNILLHARLDYLRRVAPEACLPDQIITAEMVAEFQILLKLSRNTHQKKLDNWIDIAGYAACGADCGNEAMFKML